MILLLSLCVILLIVIIYLLSQLISSNRRPKHTLYQVGHPSALFSGVAEGDSDFKALSKFGNFGLGTFNEIDGELVALNGEFFQIGKKGQTNLVKSTWKTPFAQLTFFSPTIFIDLKYIENYSKLKSLMDTKLFNKNIPYALQVKGQFQSLQLRSRTAKSGETKMEEIYCAKNIIGTLVGFWFPEYLLNIGIPGYHFHFIAHDKQLSGHVMDITIQKAQLAIEELYQLKLNFPKTFSFQDANIAMPSLQTYQEGQF